MDKNVGVSIYPTQNGWVVRRDDEFRNNCGTIGSSQVFQTMEELQTFIENHFAYRQTVVLVDKV